MFENRLPPHAVKCVGTLKNYNTVEEFKAADKTALFNKLADEVLASLLIALSFLDTHLIQDVG